MVQSKQERLYAPGSAFPGEQKAFCSSLPTSGRSNPPQKHAPKSNAWWLVPVTCYHPLAAFQLDGGEVVFRERGSVARELSLPCGRCIGCRVARAQMWAIRCMHEAQMHPTSVFVTLTYDDDKQEYNPSLEYRDFQLFMKRLRKEFRPTRIRFFMCGEYGPKGQRPHFHALLFGITFPDGQVENQSKGHYRSNLLDKLWSHGRCNYGAVTYASAGYVARYSIKKRSGPQAEDHYKRVHLSTGEIVDVTPEFGRMSLRPGIGALWFEKYWRDVYAARDGVVVNGKLQKAPRYYDELLAEIDAGLASDKDFERYIHSQEFQDDCTPERLLVRETVTSARIQHYSNRSLE